MPNGNGSFQRAIHIDQPSTPNNTMKTPEKQTDAALFWFLGTFSSPAGTAVRGIGATAESHGNNGKTKSHAYPVEKGDLVGCVEAGVSVLSELPGDVKAGKRITTQVTTGRGGVRVARFNTYT